MSGWRAFEARADGLVGGGAVVVVDASSLAIRDARPDEAVLLDIRAAPAARRQGVGSALFLAAAAWTRGRGYRTLVVETQDINVPACRFYAKLGCRLGAVRPFAYPDLPDEVQLLWYRDLASLPASAD